MPPQFLFDINGLDLNRIIHDQEEIRRYNPQRGHMEMLNAIVYVDETHHRLIGYKDVREDEFWVTGHIPGRPLLPGVLMVEAAAQLASFYALRYVGWKGFMGFSRIEQCRFRMQVAPPCRLYVLGEQVYSRHGHICCRHQGVINGNLAFESTIVGAKL
ncbi:MAG: beta-hydroxyacyl-ACP dehydratase [Tepidisphaeraceae bacterium]|jgi:3-hydroxyacyl-[acyl-carrier-protein] dehydratase